MLKESGDLDIFGVTFDFKMTFEEHFAGFPEQLLKDLISSGSPDEYSMIDRFLGDAFGVLYCPLHCPFPFPQCGARLPIHTLPVF